MNQRPLPLFALFLAACMFGLAGCWSTQSSSEAMPTDEPWLLPTPTLRQQIADEAQRLPWTHGMDRIEAIHWFAGVGEPAYPTLLEMVSDPRQDVAGAALAALGATRDTRLVPYLRAIVIPEGPAHADLHLERARTMLRLGDWSSMPVLVAGLEDKRLVTRSLCIRALFEVTKEDFGFDPRAEPEKRSESVQRWKSWVENRGVDPLVMSNPAPEKPLETTPE